MRAHVVLAALLAAACATPSLMPVGQARAIRERERALATHADTVQAAIHDAGTTGALAFLDRDSGRLVVLPGDSPGEAWARHAADSAETAPPVLTFVYRADVPMAPEPVALTVLQRQQALRSSLAAMETEVRDAHRRLEERLTTVQRELAESVAASKRDTDAAVAAKAAELQKGLSAVSDDLATARRFMLQTAQLAWLTHESNVENANGVRKVASASQELASTSARLEDTVRHLSQTLTAQLKELGSRLDNLQGKVSNLNTK